MEGASVSGRGGQARVQQVICVADHRPGPGLPARSVTATGSHAELWAALGVVLSRDLYLGSLHSHDCSPLLPLLASGGPWPFWLAANQREASRRCVCSMPW